LCLNAGKARVADGGSIEEGGEMRVGAMVVGIIGGLVALLYGVFGYAVGGVFDVGEAEAGAPARTLSIALPVVALVGAGVVMAKPLLGAILMAAAAAAIALNFDIGMFTLIPLVLLGVGALLGFLGMSEIVNGAR